METVTQIDNARDVYVKLLESSLKRVVAVLSGLSFIDRLRMLYPLLATPVDLDLLCYTPGELERMQDRPFIKHLRREEVVLYETSTS